MGEVGKIREYAWKPPESFPDARDLQGFQIRAKDRHRIQTLVCDQAPWISHLARECILDDFCPDTVIHESVRIISFEYIVCVVLPYSEILLAL